VRKLFDREAWEAEKAKAEERRVKHYGLEVEARHEEEMRAWKEDNRRMKARLKQRRKRARRRATRLSARSGPADP
jgi:hypothetical protein